MLIPSHPVPILNSLNLYGLNSLGISIHHGNPTRGWTFSGINPMTFLEPKKNHCKYTKYLAKNQCSIQSLVRFPSWENQPNHDPQSNILQFLRPSPGLTGKQTQPYLVGGIPTPLKNMSSSVGMMKFPIYGKICSKPPTSFLSLLQMVSIQLPFPIRSCEAADSVPGTRPPEGAPAR